MVGRTSICTEQKKKKAYTKCSSANIHVHVCLYHSCHRMSLGSVVKISISMPIIVDIWVFVSMISFMLGQVEHETHIFLPHRLGIMRRSVGSFVLCFAFGLSLDRVVGYADWSHTFWSCNLGRNGSD